MPRLQHRSCPYQARVGPAASQVLGYFETAPDAAAAYAKHSAATVASQQLQQHNGAQPLDAEHLQLAAACARLSQRTIKEIADALNADPCELLSVIPNWDDLSILGLSELAPAPTWDGP